MGGDCVAAPRQIRVCGKVSMAASPAGAIGGGPAIEQTLECTRGRYAPQGACRARMDMGVDCVAAPRPIRASGNNAMAATQGSAGGPATEQRLECTRGRYSPQCACATRIEMEGDYIAAPRPFRRSGKGAMEASPAAAIGGGPAIEQRLECTRG